MLTEIWTSLNWLDILMILVIVRCVYSGGKEGLVVEIFKLLGVFFATFVALHYYSIIAEAIHDKTLIPLPGTEVISLIVLWFIVAVVFKIIRDAWMLLIRSEAKGGVNQWIGGLLGLFRAFLICGLLFMLSLLTTNTYLTNNVKRSVVGFYLVDVSPKVYRFIFDGVVARFFPDEPLNLKVFEIPDMEKKK